MLRLIRLYSDENFFKEVKFKPGINLILGDKSVDHKGNVKNLHQNGVGKSLATELIDFCLMRRGSESRIISINDKYLPDSVFVYLHFACDGGEFIVARNKKGEIKIKSIDEPFKRIGFEDAKKYLEMLVGLGDKPVTLRDYLNFFIKQEAYVYKDFNELFRSTYIDILRIHFYLFGIDLDALKDIQKAFEEYDRSIEARSEVTRWLSKNDLEIDKLRAMRNEIEERVSNLEEDFDYSKIVKSLDDKKLHIAELEARTNELIEKKSLLQISLREINEYINEFSEDIYIEDDDIKIVFEKYKKGLGALAEKDLESLYKFRDQLSKFKSSLVESKKRQLTEEMSQTQATIESLNEKVSKYYRDISESDKNNIVKSFRSYKDDVYEFRQYDSQLEAFENATKRLNQAKADYTVAANKLSRIVGELKAVKDSFQSTFIDVHRYITGSSAASFDFAVDVDSGLNKKKDFFKFAVYTETSGSKGSDQIRAAIYDASLHINKETKKRTIGFILHDNLIFGVIDKVSSIKFLNLMHDKLGDSVQYIAAINSDDFDYAELREQFSFDIQDKVAIHLTKDSPLFHKIHLDFTKRP